MIELRYTPHCSKRPAGVKIEYIIIHFISAVVRYPNDPYNIEKILEILREYKVSCHYLIGRDGKKYQLVPEKEQAWHCGFSRWRKKKYLNKSSIGIELVGMDGVEYTEAQFNSIIRLLVNLVGKYGIKEENLIGHEHVSPGRRIDPGRYFDWVRVYRAIYGAGELKRMNTQKVVPQRSRIKDRGSCGILRSIIDYLALCLNQF